MSPNAPIPFLDLLPPHAELKDELMAVVSEVLDTARFTGEKTVAPFEADFAAFTGCSRAIAVSSGTDALRFALMAMDVAGKPVVTVPNTFIATTEAISQAGGKIAFVDVQPDTCLMDPGRLAELLAKRFDAGPADQRPAAVVPVHLYGQCADMTAILEITGRYGLPVLEDAAQAHGASHRGRQAGSMGAAAAFSFYPGKNLGACGEGGAVTTNDDELARTVAMIRDHGQREKYHHQVEGYNGRMDGVHAGMLQVKLRRLGQWNRARRAAAAAYDKGFAGVDWVRPVKVLDHNVSCCHLYVIHVPNRDGLRTHLQDQGIGAAMHYPIPLHLQECYAALGCDRGDFPHAEKSADELLSLPMFPTLSPDQVKRVVQAVLAYGGDK